MTTQDFSAATSGPWLKRRPPVILQAESAECGLACLTSIANFHGAEHTLASLRSAFSLSTRGATLARLMEMGTKLGLLGRALRLDLDALPRLRTPCILHWNMDHFVVLEKATSKKIWVIDPGIGRRTLSRIEASKHFTGVALELTPTEKFELGPSAPRLTLGLLLRGAKGLPRSLIQVFGLSLAIQVFALLTPIYGQIVIDDVISSRNLDLLTTMGIAFGLLVIISAAIGAVRSYAIMYLGANLKLGWAARLFHHLLALPLAYFERRSVADVLSRFKSLGAIQGLASNQLVEVVMDGIMATTTGLVMLLYSPLLATVSVAAVIIYLIARLTFFSFQLERANESIICSAREDGHFLESLRGILAIKAFGKEYVRESVWQSKVIDTVRAGLAVGALGTAQQVVNQVLTGLEGVFILWAGAWLAINDQMTIGMLVAFLAYKLQFSGRASALIDKIMEYRLVRVHLDRIADIALAEPEEGSLIGVSTEDSGAVTLSLERVSYRYSESDPCIFQNVSLHIPDGTCVAIRAPSGRGKTTLIKVMMGLLAPTDGRVLINGIEVAQSPFRAKIASVMQEDSLLSGTLSENIAFFEPNFDQAKIRQCAVLAGIHDDVERMPMKYSTLVGDMGAALSGGQKQRILLARALYAEPKILFLDEATSHLDAGTEKLVYSSLAALKMTRVLVAHRAETLALADLVVDLDEIDQATSIMGGSEGDRAGAANVTRIGRGAGQG